MKTLILASLIFLFIAVGGVVGYLYFVAEPKRHPDKPTASSEPQTSKSVDRDQEVPLPDAGPSQSSQPKQKQKQEVPSPPAQTEKEIPTPAPEDTPVPKPPPPNVVNPVLIHRVTPEYPEVAKKARVQGTVVLEVVINKKGTVENVKLLRGVHPLLDQAALSAVKKWRYKPLIQNGQPVEAHSTVTVNFQSK